MSSKIQMNWNCFGFHTAQAEEIIPTQSDLGITLYFISRTVKNFTYLSFVKIIKDHPAFSPL